MFRIKKNDMVVVLSGKDKGKRGVVLEISVKHNKVKVQGLGMVTRHYKARRRDEVSQIKRVEGFIDASKVMLFDATAQRPCRVRFVTDENGVKNRVSVNREAA